MVVIVAQCTVPYIEILMQSVTMRRYYCLFSSDFLSISEEYRRRTYAHARWVGAMPNTIVLNVSICQEYQRDAIQR